MSSPCCGEMSAGYIECDGGDGMCKLCACGVGHYSVHDSEKMIWVPQLNFLQIV